MPTKRPLRLLMLAACYSLNVSAAAPSWQVVLTPSSNLITEPGTPAPGSYEIWLPGPVISDSSIGHLNFVMRLTNGDINLWRELSGSLQPYAQIGESGVTGPGRTGAEIRPRVSPID